jgi:hypothetical protein
MAYGIEVYNSAGQTVFDSEHYCEFAAFTGTVNASTGTSGTQYRLEVPDWTYGWDKAHALTTQTVQCGVGSAHTYNNKFEMSVKLKNTSGTDVIFTKGTDINFNGAHVHSRGAQYGVTGNYYTGFDFSNAYYVYTFSKDMTSIRNSAHNRTFTPYEVSTNLPTVYARPTSSSYSGQFWGGLTSTGGPSLQTYVNGSFVYTDNPNYDSTSKVNIGVYIRDSLSGAQQFEIIVAMPAYSWGGVTGTKAHTSGTGTYGLFCGTASDKKYTPNSSTTHFTTYDTRGRPSKAALTTSQAVPSSFSTLNVSMGSLSTSSTKRWCRLDGTEFIKQDTSSGYPNYNWWGWTYNWSSNNSISLRFTSGADRGTGYALTDTLASKQFFAVSDFGLGL